jgi:hypothetical protein
MWLKIAFVLLSPHAVTNSRIEGGALPAFRRN